MAASGPTRRRLGHDAAALAALATLGGRSAAAQPAAGSAFPTRPIRVVVPFAAGSATDIMMRHLAPRMAEDLGQPITIDNRAGAAGVLGSEAVVRAPADGHVLAMAAVSSHAIAPALRRDMPYDVLRDFTPIGLSCTSTNFIVVHPSVPAQTLQELVAYSKTLPGGVSYGSGGIGGSNHLAGEMLKLRTGANLVHVPYANQGQAVNDVVGGHVPMLIYTVAILPHVQAGRLRALAVTSEQRQPQAPEVPTALEQGARDVVANSWFALFGPAGLADARRDRLNAALAGALRDPTIAARLIETGLTPAPMSSADFRRFLEAEIVKWAEVGRAANIQL
jgi:tripartite-type tricarboxylate transporter receptor subunit TctC